MRSPWKKMFIRISLSMKNQFYRKKKTRRQNTYLKSTLQLKIFPLLLLKRPSPQSFSNMRNTKLKILQKRMNLSHLKKLNPLKRLIPQKRLRLRDSLKTNTKPSIILLPRSSKLHLETTSWRRSLMTTVKSLTIRLSHLLKKRVQLSMITKMTGCD